jgi:hypothetical protein
MKRHRQVAASPKRMTSDTATTISKLIRDSFDRTEEIDLSDVDDALAKARPAFLALIAGGHLEVNPLVLTAGALHLSITSVSGDRALTLEENLSAVAGAASATEWTLYLPTPDPQGAIVTEIAGSHPRLSVEEPPSDSAATKAASSLVNLDALARRNS